MVSDVAARSRARGTIHIVMIAAVRSRPGAPPGFRPVERTYTGAGSLIRKPDSNSNGI